MRAACPYRRADFFVWQRSVSSPVNFLHVGYDIVTECRTFDLHGTVHLTGKIIGHTLAGDGPLESFDDEISRLIPTHVTEHHFATEND